MDDEREFTDEEMENMTHMELLGHAITATDSEIRKLTEELGSELGATQYLVAIQYTIAGDKMTHTLAGDIVPRVQIIRDDEE